MIPRKLLIPLPVKVMLRISAEMLERLKRKYAPFIQWEAGILKLGYKEISACPDDQVFVQSTIKIILSGACSRCQECSQGLNSS